LRRADKQVAIINIPGRETRPKFTSDKSQLVAVSPNEVQIVAARPKHSRRRGPYAARATIDNYFV
jgi:hypothetical protein